MSGQPDLFDPARPGLEPVIMLDAYQGDLTHLVQLAHAREIDLTRLDIVALIDQLAEAARAHAALPLGMKAQWAVMASGLLLLRSRLLLPADDPRQQQAEQEAHDLRARLIAAEQAGQLAGWLAARAQLGRDVHAFGGAQPALCHESAAWEVDRIEFLWGCLAVFDGNWGAMPEQTPFYAPVQLDLFSVEEARVRVRACLAHARKPVPLDRMLPDSVRRGAEEGARGTGLRRSAWSSTFTACLEMVKQGEALAYQPGPDTLPRFGNVERDGAA
ncbi:segregation/condensation protein A [Komagataeibacter xylinus]|uniref:segregation/condensation protein A n=1 Tax=Komagataeibacter xylinus TaxID=28448 RepID=UPI0010318D22|nr:segregation/condensation protein A [Komagataeibacter xylinus]